MKNHHRIMLLAALLYGSVFSTRADIQDPQARLRSEAYTRLYGIPSGNGPNGHSNSLPAGIFQGNAGWAENFTAWRDSGDASGTTLIGGRNLTASGMVSARTEISPLRVWGEASANGTSFADGGPPGALWIGGVTLTYRFSLNSPHSYVLGGGLNVSSSRNVSGPIGGSVGLYGGNDNINHPFDPEGTGRIWPISGTLSPGQYTITCGVSNKGGTGSVYAWFDLQLSPTDSPPGSSQDNPILPFPGGGNRIAPPDAFVFIETPSGGWFDPPLTEEFHFATLDGSAFRAIDSLPIGIDADDTFTVTVGSTNLGQFAGGQKVDFMALTGGGVGEFKIAGIHPQVDAGNDTAFPVKLSFLTDTADFVMSPHALPEAPLPSPWVSGDVGEPVLAGSATFSSGVFTVTGSGDDIWGVADSFQYSYRRLSGDCEIMARVLSLQSTDPWSKAGLMIREGLESGSPNAFVALSRSNGVNFQFRYLSKAPSYAANGPVIGAPGWVKLKRFGNRFTAYSSTNGIAWSEIGSTEIVMGKDIHVGLAVTSHNTSQFNTAQFDGVNFSGTNGPRTEFLKATLVHRYSFSEAPSSTTAFDSIGTAHGTIVNSKGTNFNGSGQFAMSGGRAGDGSATYIELPDKLISGLQSVTIEGWITWRGPTGSLWQRVFDFGSNSGGQGVGDMFLTPAAGNAGTTARFALRPEKGAEGPPLDGSVSFTVGAPTHFAVTYDPPNGFAKLYLNGQIVAAGTATSPLSVVEDVNVWLGRSQWEDPFFNGSFDEFRIYSGPLTDAEVAAGFIAGPNSIPGPDPMLGIQTGGGKVELSWPLGDSAGYALQFADQMGGPWSAVSLPLVTNQGVVKALVPFSSNPTNSFYRLKK